MLAGEELADAAVRGSHRVEIIFYSSKDADTLARLVKKHSALGAIHKSSEGHAFVLSFNGLVGPLVRRLRD